mgnify:CR=1 FL=1
MLLFYLMVSLHWANPFKQINSLIIYLQPTNFAIDNWLSLLCHLSVWICKERMDAVCLFLFVKINRVATFYFIIPHQTIRLRTPSPDSQLMSICLYMYMVQVGPKKRWSSFNKLLEALLFFLQKRPIYIVSTWLVWV